MPEVGCCVQSGVTVSVNGVRLDTCLDEAHQDLDITLFKENCSVESGLIVPVRNLDVNATLDELLADSSLLGFNSEVQCGSAPGRFGVDVDVTFKKDLAARIIGVLSYPMQCGLIFMHVYGVNVDASFDEYLAALIAAFFCGQMKSSVSVVVRTVDFCATRNKDLGALWFSSTSCHQQSIIILIVPAVDIEASIKKGTADALCVFILVTFAKLWCEDQSVHPCIVLSVEVSTRVNDDLDAL
jgi:hypothetical protein